MAPKQMKRKEKKEVSESDIDIGLEKALAEFTKAKKEVVRWQKLKNKSKIKN